MMHRFSKYQWLIAIVCFLIVFVERVLILRQWVLLLRFSTRLGDHRSQLGPVMSAALGGMIIRALVSGPTADRFGRKLF